MISMFIDFDSEMDLAHGLPPNIVRVDEVGDPQPLACNIVIQYSDDRFSSQKLKIGRAHV